MNKKMLKLSIFNFTDKNKLFTDFTFIMANLILFLNISNWNKIMSHFKFITIKTFKPFEALLNVFCTFNRLFSPLNALFQVQNPFQNSSQKLRHYFIPIT